ncbi:hypothetical protein ACE4ZD_013725, partial [Enterococcus faecalis]
IIGNPSLNHRYRKGFYSLFKTLQQNLIKNVVLKNARLKRYDGSGITTEKTVKGDLKQWDKKAHELFIRIYEELEEHESWFGE